jgi:hypothetical protein
LRHHTRCKGIAPSTEADAEMKLALVETLFETNASDIAAMCRELADSIDGGANPKAMVGIVVEEDGSLSLYGWGQTDSVHSLATLQLATVKMAQEMLGDE